MEFEHEGWSLHMEINPLLRALVVTVEDDKGDEVASFLIPPSKFEPLLANWVKTLHPHAIMTEEELVRQIRKLWLLP